MEDIVVNPNFEQCCRALVFTSKTKISILYKITAFTTPLIAGMHGVADFTR